jgi:hypothetical protein
MKNGDKLRLRGPAGAPFMVTVGVAFEVDYIRKMIRLGEWTPIEDEAQEQDQPGSQATGDTAPPKDDGKAPAAPTSPPDTEPTPEPTPEPAPAGKAPDPDRPAVNASKTEWITYVAQTRHMSREDAAAYTKADLIDMVS